MFVLSPATTDRLLIPRLRSLAALAISSGRRALDRKLCERREASMLRRLDRRLLEDFGVEHFAVDEQRRDTPHPSELTAGPLTAIYVAACWRLPGTHSQPYAERALRRDAVKLETHRLP